MIWWSKNEVILYEKSIDAKTPRFIAKPINQFIKIIFFKSMITFFALKKLNSRIVATFSQFDSIKKFNFYSISYVPRNISDRTICPWVSCSIPHSWSGTTRSDSRRCRNRSSDHRRPKITNYMWKSIRNLKNKRKSPVYTNSKPVHWGQSACPARRHRDHTVAGRGSRNQRQPTLSVSSRSRCPVDRPSSRDWFHSS